MLHDRVFATVLCDAYSETDGNGHECDLQGGRKERVKRGREIRRDVRMVYISYSV